MCTSLVGPGRGGDRFGRIAGLPAGGHGRCEAGCAALPGAGSGYPAGMNRLDHLEHLDEDLVDELAQVAREAVRDELREQTRKQRRTAALYAASGAVGLYAGAALAGTRPRPGARAGSARLGRSADHGGGARCRGLSAARGGPFRQRPRHDGLTGRRRGHRRYGTLRAAERARDALPADAPHRARRSGCRCPRAGNRGSRTGSRGAASPSAVSDGGSPVGRPTKDRGALVVTGRRAARTTPPPSPSPSATGTRRGSDPGRRVPAPGGPRRPEPVRPGRPHRCRPIHGTGRRRWGSTPMENSRTRHGSVRTGIAPVPGRTMTAAGANRPFHGVWAPGPGDAEGLARAASVRPPAIRRRTRDHAGGES